LLLSLLFLPNLSEKSIQGVDSKKDLDITLSNLKAGQVKKRADNDDDRAGSDNKS